MATEKQARKMKLAVMRRHADMLEFTPDDGGASDALGNRDLKRADGDCVTRAYAIATGKGYKYAARIVAATVGDYCQRHGVDPADRERVAAAFGFVPATAGVGGTVRDACQHHAAAVVSVTGHATAIKDYRNHDMSHYMDHEVGHVHVPAA